MIENRIDQILRENESKTKKLRHAVREIIIDFLKNSEMPEDILYSSTLTMLMENIVNLTKGFGQDPVKTLFFLEKAFAMFSDTPIEE